MHAGYAFTYRKTHGGVAEDKGRVAGNNPRHR